MRQTVFLAACLNRLRYLKYLIFCCYEHLSFFDKMKLLDQLSGMIGAAYDVGRVIDEQRGDSHTVFLTDFFIDIKGITQLQELFQRTHTGRDFHIGEFYVIFGKNLFHWWTGASVGTSV